MHLRNKLSELLLPMSSIKFETKSTTKIYFYHEVKKEQLETKGTLLSRVVSSSFTTQMVDDVFVSIGASSRARLPSKTCAAAPSSSGTDEHYMCHNRN